MRTNAVARALAIAGTLAGLSLAGITAASATSPPPGYPGTPETLDWPKGGTVMPVPPPPDSGPKPEGPIGTPDSTPSTTRKP